MALMSLLAINQMPKLPWLESMFGSVGGELGPIYGPRYVRLQARVVFMIATFAWSLSVSQPLAWRSVPYILVASALLVVWSFAMRRHLSRRWQLERRRGGA